jgi:hypothetical protein
MASTLSDNINILCDIFMTDWQNNVFIIFINFFGQLKDWVGLVLFLVSCPKEQVEKYVNVEAWSGE